MGISLNKPILWSWSLYDWGNSAFSAIVQTFVFAAYFTEHVAKDPTLGTAQWGFSNAIAAIIIAVSGPIFGAIADHSGFRKRWTGAFTLACILSTALLWFVTPQYSPISFAIGIVIFAIVTSELAFVFYNAMLPNLAPPREIGRWSGIGWSLGYAGGMVCLILSLFCFVLPEHSLFNLNRESYAHIRITFPLAALWYLIFSIPLFLFTPETNGKRMPIIPSIQQGLKELKNTISHIRQFSHIVRFLIAHMFFIDALTTLFVFGGVYGSYKFGMTAQEILIFGISLHLTAGIGAAAFGWIDDRVGSKKTIMISLLGLIIPTTILIFVQNTIAFWMIGLLIGIFVGPVQSASRSYMAKITPKHLQNEMFGFFAMSGKVTAFLGPLLVGWSTLITHSQDAIIYVILSFLVIGLLLMRPLPENSAKVS